jgi:excisionase family DNA binding protein
MITTPITLDPDQLERLADLIAVRLESLPAELVAPATDLLTAEELAAQLKVDTKTVYRHAARLGAIRVGRRLRFDPAKALDAWRLPAGLVASEHKRARARAPSGSATGDLLPVGRRTR